MAYVLELSDALKHVMATGIAEEEAQADICRAIAGRKINVRFLVAKEEGVGSFDDLVAGPRFGATKAAHVVAIGR